MILELLNGQQTLATMPEPGKRSIDREVMCKKVKSYSNIFIFLKLTQRNSSGYLRTVRFSTAKPHISEHHSNNCIEYCQRKGRNVCTMNSYSNADCFQRNEQFGSQDLFGYIQQLQSTTIVRFQQCFYVFILTFIPILPPNLFLRNLHTVN